MQYIIIGDIYVIEKTLANEIPQETVHDKIQGDQLL